MTEHRLTGELRAASGRRIEGVALRYGDMATLPDGRRERFEPGAFGTVIATRLNLQHDVEVRLGSATLMDGPTALRAAAAVPEAVHALVRRGALNGFSVEFNARAERDEGGVRVIERADLAGLAVVDRGAYPAATVEARARSGRTLRGLVPVDDPLLCECIGQGRAGSECVPLVRFQREVVVQMAAAIQGAIATAQRDVLAVFKDYGRPLGSARRGTLRARAGDAGLDIEVDLPTGEAGDMAVSAAETAGIITRPLIDDAASEFVDGPDGRIYQAVRLRAILVGSTDARQGWPDATISYAESEARATAHRRRVRWL